MLSYLLFAYRETPKVSTGFSPLELLYGRQVCRQLGIFYEFWPGVKESEESVVSYPVYSTEHASKNWQIVIY